MTLGGGGKTYDRLYLWHPELHRSAHQQLIFLMVECESAYDQQELVAEVRGVLEQGCGVTSFVIWELIGTHDLLLKCWLPSIGPGSSHVDITTVEKMLTGSTKRRLIFWSARIEQSLLHWLWDDVQIDRNRFDEIDPRDKSALNFSDVPKERIRRYESLGFIRPVNYSRTLKIFQRIKLSENAVDHFDDLLAVVRSIPEFTRASIYAEQRGFLISGRIRPTQFEVISTRLSPQIHQLGRKSHPIKTISHLSSLCRPVLRVERLSWVSPDSIDYAIDTDFVRALLNQPEGDDLEVKAFALASLEDMVASGRVSAFTDGPEALAKAVCAFLNTSGGFVVVGCAEPDEYDLSSIQRAMPNAHRIGRYLAVGVETEYELAASKGRSKGWDTYERKIRSLIDTRFESSPLARISITPVPVAENVTLCVIRVQQSKSWAYLKPKGGGGSPIFYGRYGGESKPLHGVGQDEHKERHKR